MVHQPGVKFADYSEIQPTPMSYLKEWMIGTLKKTRSSAHVAEVLGDIDSAALAQRIGNMCGAEQLSVDVSSKCPPSGLDGQTRLIFTSWIH